MLIKNSAINIAFIASDRSSDPIFGPILSNLSTSKGIVITFLNKVNKSLPSPSYCVLIKISCGLPNSIISAPSSPLLDKIRRISDMFITSLNFNWVTFPPVKSIDKAGPPLYISDIIPTIINVIEIIVK